MLESGEVVCSAWSYSGGTDLSARRLAALDLASTCAATVNGDRELGGLLVPPGLASAGEFRYQPRQTPEGAICRVVFTVAYSSLITT